MSRAHVVLVDDDAMMHRFVRTALERLEIDLSICGSVSDAVRLLATRKADLVFTDLVLPCESGFVLLESLAHQPELRGSARVAVFSADVSLATRRQLAAYGVWQVLSKPVSVNVLESCVRAALGAVGGDKSEDTRAANVHADAQLRAVGAHFGGNRELYEAFRAACLQQFPNDVAAGNAACQAGDMSALRLLAHNLATVLLMLGHDALAEVARHLERQLVAGQTGLAHWAWQQLCRSLGELTRTGRTDL